MADPEADRCNVDEAEETLNGLVVAGCNASRVLKFVAASLDQIAQAIGSANDADTLFAGLAHRDDRQRLARLHARPDAVGVVASIRQ